MNSVEFGFPFGELLKPTTDELNFVRDNLIPDPSIEFHVGYESMTVSASYGIRYGFHGYYADKHWVEGEPSEAIGSIYSTNQYGIDEETGERIPLFASSTLQLNNPHVPPQRPFICVRTLTEEFPADLGFFNEEYDCSHVTRKAFFQNLDSEYATLSELHNFADGKAICEDSAQEGFSNGEIHDNDDDGSHVYVRIAEELVFNPEVRPWVGFMYNRKQEAYISVYDSSTQVNPIYWYVSQPLISEGECVIAYPYPSFFYGPLATSECNALHEVVCERDLVTLDALAPKLQINGKEFTIMPDKKHFRKAQKKCEARGARLMNPTTEELKLIQNLVPGNFSLWQNKSLERNEKRYYVCEKDLISRQEEVEGSSNSESKVMVLVGGFLVVFGIIFLIGTTNSNHFFKREVVESEETTL